MILKRNNPQPLSRNVCYIPIGSHQFAIISPEDYNRVSSYRWRLYRSSNCWYVARKFRHNGKTSLIKLHRFIMNALPGYEIHHSNHNPKDCRKSNLEQLTPAEHRAKHMKT